MDVQKWRSNPQRVDDARQMFATQLWGDIFSILHNAMPRGYPLRGMQVDPTSAAIELGRKEGFADAIAILESLAVSDNKAVDHIPSEFGVTINDNTTIPASL